MLAALTAAMACDAAWARGRHSGGARSGSHPHHHARVRSGFFFAAPFWHPFYPGLFPYRPLPYEGLESLQPRFDPTVVYVEQFAGKPGPTTEGEIYCAGRNAHYPEVQDCPGGWQRVFRPQAAVPIGAK
jgi:hypothetical protein